MPDTDWLRRWDDKHGETAEKKEIANMDVLDFATLLEEIDHH